MSQVQQLRKGSTPLLILTVLSQKRMYGYEIMRELERRSDGYFTMTAALLYPALHQLEAEGLLSSEWQETQGKRRRKYYSITTKGKKALATRRSEWDRFIANLQKTIEPSLENLGETGS